MAGPAISPMRLDDFLRWDDGTETHYELIGGFAVAMAPPAEARRILAMRPGVADRLAHRWPRYRPRNKCRPGPAELRLLRFARCTGNDWRARRREPGRQAVDDP
jgi:hypothetical protein